MGWERVHFEGPEPGRVPGEMSAFLEWFNSPPETDGVIRAATAHLWFAAVHPFQDGNGRIARAITDMALARSQQQPHAPLQHVSPDTPGEERVLPRPRERRPGDHGDLRHHRLAQPIRRVPRPGHGRRPGGALDKPSAAQHNAALMEQARPAAPQPQAAPGAGALIREPEGDHHRGQVTRGSTAPPGKRRRPASDSMVQAMLLEESPQESVNPTVPARTRRMTAKAAQNAGPPDITPTHLTGTAKSPDRNRLRSHPRNRPLKSRRKLLSRAEKRPPGEGCRDRAGPPPGPGRKRPGKHPFRGRKPGIFRSAEIR